jgi:hypothetical protein
VSRQPAVIGYRYAPGGRLVFHVFAALAEFIRELIVEGTREGPGRRPRSRLLAVLAACTVADDASSNQSDVSACSAISR